MVATAEPEVLNAISQLSMTKMSLKLRFYYPKLDLKKLLATFLAYLMLPIQDEVLLKNLV